MSTTILLCTCGHGIENHKGGDGACKAQAKGTEGCTFEGQIIPCECEQWNVNLIKGTTSEAIREAKESKSKSSLGPVGIALIRSRSSER
jgi:hypothetical protein